MEDGKCKMLSYTKSRFAGENVERSEIPILSGENGEKNFEFRISNFGLIKNGNGKPYNHTPIHSYFYVSMFFYVSMCLIFVLSSGTIKPQSVDSLLNEAVRNNPQLEALQYKIQSSEYRAESANSLPAPNLAVEFTQVPVSEVNVWDKAISNSIALSQMIPLGGKVSAMTEVEKRNITVAKNDYDVYRINLTGQIKMEYYTLWLIDRKIDIQESTIKLQNDLINSIDVLYQVNRINQADVLSLRSEIASSQAQLVILRNQREAQIYKLNKLIGRDLSSTVVFAVKDLPDDSLGYSQQELEEVLVNGNPSLQKMNSMIEMNKAMITANNRELIPDLMVQGMLMRMPQGMLLTSKTDLAMLAMEPAKTEYMYSIMASINLPFAPWSVKKYSAKSDELASGIRSIEQEKMDMQRDMQSGLKAAFVKLNTAKELQNLYSQQVIPSFKQSLESQTSAYQNGRTSINTVIDSYRMLLMQEMNYYMAQADSRMAVAEIEMMVGGFDGKW